MMIMIIINICILLVVVKKSYQRRTNIRITNLGVKWWVVNSSEDWLWDWVELCPGREPSHDSLWYWPQISPLPRTNNASSTLVKRETTRYYIQKSGYNNSSLITQLKILKILLFSQNFKFLTLLPMLFHIWNCIYFQFTMYINLLNLAVSWITARFKIKKF